MKSLINLLLAFAFISGCLMPDASYAVVAGGMATIHRTWPPATNGYNDMEFTITITKEPGYDGRTYWAHQWGFSGVNEGGYVGLQSRSGNEKALNFSIWAATGWQNSTGATCNHFSHEGSGVQCSINYPWKEGRTYKIKVAKTGTNGWTATIIDMQTNESRTVATILVPANYGGLKSLSEWVENFAQGNTQLPSCSAVPEAIAVYGMPTANGGAVKPSGSSTYTYGNCASIAKSVCTTEQVCTLSANPSAPLAQQKLKNEASGYCLDMLGGTSVAGLYTCYDGGNANQQFSQDDSYRLHLSKTSALCLTVSGNDAVATAACNNSANQQWLKVERTQALFNAGSARCMDPFNNERGLPIRTYPCLDNGLQRWRMSP